MCEGPGVHSEHQAVLADQVAATKKRNLGFRAEDGLGRKMGAQVTNGEQQKKRGRDD